MEARSAAEIPAGPQWQYEPKWDGFRCLLSRSGRAVRLLSKSAQDLTRYFPEVAAAAAAALPENSFSLDGELVIPLEKHFSFDALLQRIHPAASRIKRLAAETPALYIAFDLLRRGRADLAIADLTMRRPELEEFAAHCFANTLFRLSPTSKKISDAKRWLANAGEDSDGVIAKRVDLPYQAGNRDGMVKIKCYCTADCVIGGFRYGEQKRGGKNVVGSLLLGLYDNQGMLHHVGFTSGLKAEEKPALTKRLQAIETKTSFTGNAPGGLGDKAFIAVASSSAKPRCRGVL
jgi:ATP-dependent DNA ligase